MTCTTLLAVFTLGACNGLAGHDEMDRYFQRSDTITMSAGNAKEVNIAAQTIHPWPKGVNDRRIVVQAAKTNGAMTRYRAGNQPRDPLPAFGVSSAREGHAPMGLAGAIGAAVDAGGTVFQGTAPGTLGAGTAR